MQWMKRLAERLAPTDAAWKGATRAALLWAGLLLALLAWFMAAEYFWVGRLLGFLAFAGVLVGAALAVWLSFWLLSLLRGGFRLALLIAILVGLFYSLMLWSPPRGIIVTLALAIAVSLAGGGIGALRQNGFGIARSVAAGLGLAVIGGFLFLAFSPVEDQNPWIAKVEEKNLTLDLPDPGKPGDFEVTTFTYGPGTDLHREEFGKAVRFTTGTVDGSRLVDRWEGPVGWARTRYWGFDHKALPLNGRVWMPANGDEGPFPLVLVVHGNHSMEDFSDPGYDYLGELLASRGIITVSVDENFLNSSIADFVSPVKSGIGRENDARGWMLLKHLEVWRGWNSEVDHPLFGQFDMDRIALIGHSRGGEAVAVAAAFNNLDRYPDDAMEVFDFGFNLRGIIAIAPADGQYNPRSDKKRLKDISYLTIHGSMDGDVQSFMGASQFSRIDFSGDRDVFKASLYVEGANHGQFNTSWGRRDLGQPFGWLFNDADIMPKAEQEQIAKVWFSAFLDTVFDRADYRALLADPREGADWLPDHYMLANLVSSEAAMLANAEEDMNPSTGTSNLTRIGSANLTKWRENNVSLKWNPLDTQAIVLAWDREVNPDTASWTLSWAAGSQPLGEGSRFVFSMADANIGTKPKGWEAPEDTGDGDAKDEDTDDEDGLDVPEGLDWTLVLTDVYGNEARLALSHDSKLWPQVRAKTRKLPMLESIAPSEPVFRRFSYPVAAFLEANPDLQPTALESLRFEFDRSESGSIVIDDFAVEEVPGAMSSN